MAKLKHTHMVRDIAVVGSGPFPIDMLRYDSCAPRTQSDSAAIKEPHTRIVQFRMFIQEANQGPEEARWRSFNWVVLSADEFVAYGAGPIESCIDRVRAVLAVRGIKLPSGTDTLAKLLGDGTVGREAYQQPNARNS